MLSKKIMDPFTGNPSTLHRVQISSPSTGWPGDVPFMVGIDQWKCEKWGKGCVIVMRLISLIFHVFCRSGNIDTADFVLNQFNHIFRLHASREQSEDVSLHPSFFFFQFFSFFMIIVSRVLNKVEI